MKKNVLLGVIVGVLLTYSIAFASGGCCDPDKDTGKMKCESDKAEKDCTRHGKAAGMEHSMMKGDKDERGHKAVEQDGYKFQFDFIDMDMPKMTHHLMVAIEDAAGKKVTDAEVIYKTVAPSGKEGKAMAMKMGGSFGGNINLSEKGKHKIEATVEIGDKEILVKTHYETK